MRVLIIEDDADTRANLRDILEIDKYQADTAATAAAALDRKQWSVYSAILLDRQLPDGNAEILLPRLKALAPDAGVIVITGYADLAGAIAAMRQGAADYILKPINADALRASLARIAEHQRMATAMQRSEAAFRKLVEMAPCMVVILRHDGSIAYFSPFAERLTGYTFGEVAGKNFQATFVAEGDAARQSAGFQQVVQRKDGSPRWVVWNTEHLPDYNGQPAILQIGQDITQLKEAQEQTLQAERLATIGQMVTGLAHESRNALQLIQASLEMLALEVEDKPEALELIGSIQGAEDRLHRLFEDIRGYAAPLHLEKHEYVQSKIWRQAWNQIAPARQTRQVELHEPPDADSQQCWVDLFSLERVFRNIFENAVAACRDPVQVDITCSQAVLNGRPAVRIAVADNGPGLTTEQQKRIFQPFFTTKRQGTGLGMAIAKRIIDAHGGQISASNGERSGAEVVIMLPREKA